MSEDWAKGWYRQDKPSGAGPGSEPTHDMTVAQPSAGRTPGAPGTPGAPEAPWGQAAPPGAAVFGSEGYGYGSASPGAAGPAPGAGGAWPQQPPDRSGYPGGPRRRRRGGWWRRWGWPKRISLILAVFVVLVIVTGVITYFDLNGKLSRVNVLVDYPGRPVATAGTNWLITGSDSRGGLTRAQEDQLALGHDIGGGRSDTIMVLHIPANGTKPVLVSIPRDSYVPIPGHGWNKINAAYAFGGPKLLAETVQNVTGLRINHYLGIGVGGLVSVVNDVGGVRMCLPQAMSDPKAGLNLKKGCQNLNGAQVLAFTRTRAFPLGDLQREQDQRVLLSSLLKKMMSPGVMINPFSSIPAASGAAGALTVDSGTSLYSLLSVGFALRGPESTTVPFGGFENTSVGSVVVWDKAAATELFNDLATDKAVPKGLISGTSIQGTA